MRICYIPCHGTRCDASCAGQIRCAQAFARRANAPPLGGGGGARDVAASRGSLRRQGCRERPSGELAAGGRARAQSGRRQEAAHCAWLLIALEKLVDPVTRGDPSGPLRWTCSSAARLAQELGAAGHRVSERTVNRMLHDAGYSLQANRKTLEGNQHPDAQFKYINRRVKAFQRLNQPVV